MSAFNFRAAVNSVKTEGEIWRLAVKSGVSIKYFKHNGKKSDRYWYEFTNLGELEGHDVFIVKGVMGWLNGGTFQGNCHGLGKTKLVQRTLYALFRAYHVFQKLDGPWINASKPSEFTFANFFNLIWKNTKDGFEIGIYTVYYERMPSTLQNNIPKIAQKLNMGMDEVAVWCGMDASFCESLVGDRDCEEVCKDYVRGIAKCFETKKRKREDAYDAEEQVVVVLDDE